MMWRAMARVTDVTYAADGAEEEAEAVVGEGEDEEDAETAKEEV